MEEQATIAAARARVLAKNVSGKAQDFATVATANAKVIAEKLKEDAKSLAEHKRWQEAAEKAKATLNAFPFLRPTRNRAVSQVELEAYGITDSYKDFVRSLDYSTFRDFNEQELQTSVGFLKDEEGTLRLNPWQEQHAVLALKVFNELDHLRYLLCPKRMTEEKFWLVYFSLAQSHLPEGCKTGQVPELAKQDPASPPNEQTDDPMQKDRQAMSDAASKSEDDDLDKYLNDVLQEETDPLSSKDEGFEDLDDYMEQLNAELSSQQDPSIASDLIESLDDSPEEKEETVPLDRRPDEPALDDPQTRPGHEGTASPDKTKPE